MEVFEAVQTCQERKFITKTFKFAFFAVFTESESWKCDFNMKRLEQKEEKVSQFAWKGYEIGF